MGARIEEDPHPCCFERVIDEVGNDLTAPQQSWIARHVGVCCVDDRHAHADARGVDHDVGAGDVADDADRCCLRETCCLLGTVTGPVQHRDVGCASSAQRIDHRSGGTPGPDHRDLSSIDLDASCCQRRHETRAVGTRPDEFVTVPADGVHRVQGPRCRIETIDCTGDIFLERHRDRQASDPEKAHRRQRRSCIGDVKRGIRPVDAGCVECGLVNCRRQAVRHRRADDRSDPWRAHPPPNSTPANSRMLASCCSNVAANA